MFYEEPGTTIIDADVLSSKSVCIPSMNSESTEQEAKLHELSMSDAVPDRQGDTESRSLADLAVNVDAPIVFLDDAVG